MTKLFKEDGNYTQEGRDFATIIDGVLDELISRYYDKYNRIEFEYLMLTEIPFRFSLHAINTKSKK